MQTFVTHIAFAFSLLIVMFSLPGCQAAQKTGNPGEPVRLRFVTYNIHHGQGMDGQFDLPRIAGVIKQLDPDFVALQEVDVQTNRAMGVDQIAELGELTGMHAAFGKAMDYDGGGYGEGVLSRLPIEKVINHPLPADDGFEPRSALAVIVKLADGSPLMFVGTHLDHTRDPKQRMM